MSPRSVADPDLSPEDVTAFAYGSTDAVDLTLAAEHVRAVEEGFAHREQARARGLVYGLITGVGALRDEVIDHADDSAGHALRLGRPSWVDPGPLADDVTRLQAGGATAVVLEVDGAPAGVIGVRDELRPEAAGVVAQLRAQGYTVAMLTGDNAATAAALAAAAGFTEVHADLRPEDKSRLVAGFRDAGQVTAMVGDGVNDAPALATADLGIAMGAMGADVAIEIADVALMGADLRLLPGALAHARRTRRIILQNVVLSLVLIAVLIPLAAAGVLGLAAVVLVHEVAEVFVIANGVRAGRSTQLILATV